MRIESRLASLNLSAADASRRAGLSEDAIRNIRRAVAGGRNAGVSTRTLESLAPVLQTTSHWLIDGDMSAVRVPDIFNEKSTHFKSGFFRSLSEKQGLGATEQNIEVIETELNLIEKVKFKSLIYIETNVVEFEVGGFYVFSQLEPRYVICKFHADPDRFEACWGGTFEQKNVNVRSNNFLGRLIELRAMCIDLDEVDANRPNIKQAFDKELG